jgi:hypothetical protein
MLLPQLVDIASDAAKAKTWPASPRALAGRLRRAAPNLRRVGISIIFGAREAKGRPITIHQIGEASDRHDRHHRHQTSDSAAPGDDGRMTDDGAEAATVIATVTPDPSDSAVDDRRDGDDGRMHPHSAGDQEPAEWTL